MIFRDQSHIDQVHDALWKRYRGACVMIGSGFSRNARETRPNGGTTLQPGAKWDARFTKGFTPNETVAAVETILLKHLEPTTS